MSSTGVLLLNVGTPDAPDVRSVRDYLREFLSDPCVIDLPAWQRWLLLNLFILPFRPKRSAAAYQQIWTDQGSPLLIYSQQLRDQLAHELGASYQVAVGMRYGQPTIQSAVNFFQQQQCQRLILLPLFPQYSMAVTGSVLAATLKCLAERQYAPEVILHHSFYHHADYIHSLAQVIKENIVGFQADYFLFSFHGIPERQRIRSCFVTTCDDAKDCSPLEKNNAYCYRAQCYATGHLVANALSMNPSGYGVAFQSRVGRATWIKPYTTVCLTELFQRGVRNIAVICPSFIVDCLETLEEMGIRGHEQWKMLGGREFKLIPALNTHPQWIRALATIIKQKIS